jgi:hypothetical protein
VNHGVEEIIKKNKKQIKTPTECQASKSNFNAYTIKRTKTKGTE